MAGATYKCKYKNSDKELENEIHKYCEYYNEEIDFIDYYYKIYNCKLGHDGKDKCKLHDEVNGESFSYSRTQKIWSCWGSCKTTAAGVVEYHMMYLRKTKPFTTIIDAMNSLHQMYPHLPKFNYNPRRKIVSTRVTNLSRLRNRIEKYNENKTTVETATTNINSVKALEDFNCLCLYCFTNDYFKNKEGKRC